VKALHPNKDIGNGFWIQAVTDENNNNRTQ
jgi:hypothetical protein